MPVNDLTLALVGSGGDGVVSAGDMLSLAAARVGLNVIKTEAYGPQIRGGEASCTVRISSKEIHAQSDKVDVLVVFNWADFKRFKGELAPAKGGVVLFESADTTPLETVGINAEDVEWTPVPLMKIATDAAGTKAAKNIVALGVLAEMFGLPADAIGKAVENKFGKKKAGVLEANMKGFDAGLAWAREQPSRNGDRKFSYVPGEPKLLMSGNEATAVGALHAGCRFFSGYPITPSSEVLHFLSEWMPKVGGSVVQTEDELAAIGAVIGASFAGVKAMTATSGPGLSLMTEMIGLSGMAEVPAVIVNVQRGGPSTGLPTKSEQSDLFQAVWGSHGDAPRVVLACDDVEDSFHATVDAFNIAEEFQLPVIVLSEQSVAQRRETVPAAALTHDVISRTLPTGAELKDYDRYKDTPSGVSPMSVPGIREGIYQTNGLEHDEAGHPSSMHLMHEKMNLKRYRKLRPVRDKYHGFRRFGAAEATIGILCWGSSRGPVQEAVEAANADGLKVAAFVPRLLYPFPKNEFEDFLRHVKEVLVVELSFAAQFYKYLRTFLDLPERHTHIFKRSGGKNLSVVEVTEQILRVVALTSQREEVLI